MPEHLNPEQTALIVKDVAVKLGSFIVLEAVSFWVPKAAQTVIIGPNGAGKTTFLLALLGQIAFSGSIVINPAKAKLAYVPQKLDFDRHMPLTVMEFLSLNLSKRPLWLGLSKIIKEKTKKYLNLVKAEHLIKRQLGHLSGGELQRVLLATALAQKPDILILDEPSTGIDTRGEELLCEILDSLKNKFNLTQVVVSHDLATSLAHADWVVCLNRSVIAQGKPSEIINKEILAATFGQHQGSIKLK